MHLVSNRAADAAIYPEKLVDAMIDGVVENAFKNGDQLLGLACRESLAKRARTTSEADNGDESEVSPPYHEAHGGSEVPLPHREGEEQNCSHFTSSPEAP